MALAGVYTGNVDFVVVAWVHGVNADSVTAAGEYEGNAELAVAAGVQKSHRFSGCGRGIWSCGWGTWHMEKMQMQV